MTVSDSFRPDGFDHNDLGKQWEGGPQQLRRCAKLFFLHFHSVSHLAGYMQMVKIKLVNVCETVLEKKKIKAQWENKRLVFTVIIIAINLY